MMLAQSRPKSTAESIEKARLAISHRKEEWGVDGGWSYDFSSLGHTCATTHSGAKLELGDSDDTTTGDECDPHIGSAKRCNVLKAAADRVVQWRRVSGA